MVTRQSYAIYYDEVLGSLPGLRAQPRPKDGRDRHALHLYVIILEPGAYQKSRNEIVDALLAENIGAAIHYRAVHSHPYYREKYHFQPGDFPHAYQAGENIFTLPLSPSMNRKDLHDVAEATTKVLSAYLA